MQTKRVNETHLDNHVLLRLACGGGQGRAELLQEAGQVLDLLFCHICLNPQIWHFCRFEVFCKFSLFCRHIVQTYENIVAQYLNT